MSNYYKEVREVVDCTLEYLKSVHEYDDSTMYYFTIRSLENGFARIGCNGESWSLEKSGCHWKVTAREEESSFF